MRMGGRNKEKAAQNYAITTAPKPLSQDIRSRESKYLMAMGIRVVAFILIVVLPIAWGWKIGLAALALILPYVAVVYANGGRERTSDRFDQYQDADRLALTRGVPGRDETGPAAPLSGTIVDDPSEEPAGDPRHRPET
jgi:hypothetical protein